VTDTSVVVKLEGLAGGTPIRLDGRPTDAAVPVPEGRHEITFGTDLVRPPSH